MNKLKSNHTYILHVYKQIFTFIYLYIYIINVKSVVFNVESIKFDGKNE